MPLQDCVCTMRFVTTWISTIGCSAAFRGLCGRAGVEQRRRKTNQSLLMSTPILDPSLPADPSPLDAGEMRDQFQALANKLDAVINTLNA